MVDHPKEIASDVTKSVVNEMSAVPSVTKWAEKIDSKIKLKKEAEQKAEKALGSEEAKEKAKNALESERTKEALKKLEKIDERIKNMPESERWEYNRAIETYNNIKNDIQKRMEEDLNFKEAVKQMWMNLDMKDQSLNALGEPEAWNEASKVLNNKEAKKQIREGNFVMSSIDKLSPSQQKALDDRSNYTRASIENLARDLGLD